MSAWQSDLLWIPKGILHVNTTKIHGQIKIDLSLKSNIIFNTFSLPLSSNKLNQNKSLAENSKPPKTPPNLQNHPKPQKKNSKPTSSPKKNYHQTLPKSSTASSLRPFLLPSGHLKLQSSSGVRKQRRESFKDPQ